MSGKYKIECTDIVTISFEQHCAKMQMAAMWNLHHSLRNMLEKSFRWASSLHGLWKLLVKLPREETG